MVSVKTHAKLANMSVEERDKAIDKLSEENAKYLLKIAYKAMFNPPFPMTANIDADKTEE